ncbi:MAG: PQQ-binding-like beta-propeller repeat protein [Verrucomicrobiae bacterium]|nr:PQQ-binding-like beta-propeller repeat protein [Verrucomicrobiae bacterium]
MLASPFPVAADDWTEFRGPDGQGHSPARNVPVEWSSSRNVAWETDVEGKGWSSPVVAGDRVFLTSAIEKGGGLELFTQAFDRESGKPAWETKVFEVGDAFKIHKKNSHASPTPVFEDGRLYVHFGHDGTACLDARTGEIVWKRDSLYRPVHGNGGSPLILGDKLIFGCDGNADPFIVALNKANGDTIWKTPRDIEVKRPFSFTTPLAIEVDGKTQVISPASGAVFSYDPESGRELWRCRYGEGYSVVPRPVFANGLLYICSGFNTAILFAIRPDGKGDVTDTHIAWQTQAQVPKESSPIAVDGLLFFNDDKGVTSCVDGKTGELHWQERLSPGSYSSSPVYAGGKLYFQSGAGVTTVIEPSKKFKKVAENDMSEPILASLAVTDGALFLRTESKLYRIGK